MIPCTLSSVFSYHDFSTRRGANRYLNFKQINKQTNKRSSVCPPLSLDRSLFLSPFLSLARSLSLCVCVPPPQALCLSFPLSPFLSFSLFQSFPLSPPHLPLPPLSPPLLSLSLPLSPPISPSLPLYPCRIYPL